MTTTIEAIRAMAEDLLDDKSPREERLAQIVAALRTAYNMGCDHGHEKAKEAFFYDASKKPARDDL
jgi:hypothetical protein